MHTVRSVCHKLFEVIGSSPVPLKQVAWNKSLVNWKHLLAKVGFLVDSLWHHCMFSPLTSYIYLPMWNELLVSDLVVVLWIHKNVDCRIGSFLWTGADLETSHCLWVVEMWAWWQWKLETGDYRADNMRKVQNFNLFRKRMIAAVTFHSCWWLSEDEERSINSCCLQESIM